MCFNISFVWYTSNFTFLHSQGSLLFIMFNCLLMKMSKQPIIAMIATHDELLTATHEDGPDSKLKFKPSIRIVSSSSR